MSVVRKDGEKRRPMLSTFDGNNRHMLTEIRNSLSHLRKEDGSIAAVGPLQCRPDAAQYVAAAEGQMSASSAAKGTRSVKYTQKALAEIKQSLEGYQVSESSPAGLAPPNGYDVELQRVNEHHLRQLIQMGYDEDFAIRALKMSGNKSVDDALETIHKLSHANGFSRIPNPGLTTYGTKVIRKPSFEEKYRTGSPVNSENSSVRSDSPVPGGTTRGVGSANVQTSLVVPTVVGQRAECQTPPPLPPRGMQQVGMNGRGHTPPPPPQTLMGPTSYMDQRTGVVYQSYLDQRTGKHVLVPRQAYGAAGSAPVTPQRGMSPVMNSRHPVMMPQNMHSPNSVHGGVPPHGPGRPVQVNGRISGNSSPGEGIPMSYPMPPQMYYTVMSGGAGAGYNQLPVGGPEQSQYYILQSDSSPLSSHSPSPAPTPIQGQGHVSPNQAALQNPSQLNGSRLNNQPVPMHTWSTKQQPIFMHQAKSREVQKPVLQTATAPMSPPAANQQQQPQQHNTGDNFQHSSQTNYISSVHTQVNSSPHQHQQQQMMPAAASSHPSHPTHISLPGHPYSNFEIEITRAQSRGQLDHSGPSGPHSGNKPIQIGLHFQAGPNANNYPVQHLAYPAGCTPGSTPRSESPVPRVANQSPLSVISTTSTPSTSSDIPDKPPPPYPGLGVGARISNLQFINAQPYFRPLSPHQEEKLVIKHGPPSDDSQDSRTADSQDAELDDKASVSSQSEASSDSPEKHHCTSPKPQRRAEACMRDAERQETQVKHYSPQAFKFYIEQHMENVMNQHKQRELRRLQLEREMARVDLSEEAQTQMRKMLYQKESNYIRLKRARMEKSMFEKIKTLGIGAFGEVALVRKRDKGHLYAMKTLRKRDVLSKNQVAHVKAERDILAEADNEWVVKLYYSFQDKNNLYFVMDYIPGGDMMSLLIKFGIFEEPLAQFYIAELVLAIESVHKMGFIHRDIKPDNILIDKDGHIKLTDFGLCTGFRWTHNSKYYQKGNHGRQDSMEPVEGWTNECNCDTKEIVLKPLERRKLRHQRCLAHSLVGTPNYIAPEVLLRSGYNKSCDWWSVGVILYEMLVGQPPFLANTPAETQLKVIHWESALNIPKEANLSPAACNIIVNLCCSPENRLGREDARELKRHPFFNGICFEALRQQVAPYIPQIRSPTDTSHFDEVPQDKLRDVDSPEGIRKDAYENGKHPEHAFLEFTFRRFFDETGQMFMPRFPNEPFVPLPCMPDEHFISALPEEPELEQEESSDSNTPVYV